MTQREKDIEQFYKLMKRLEERVGGKRRLSECSWNMGWPEQGVYFFFEDGETRTNSESDLRVVRVGSHAFRAGSKSHLWHRLYQHKLDLGRSVFRDHVGRALKERSKTNSSFPEHNHSLCISTYIGEMPFLWVNVDGEDGHLLRKSIERNVIALLSNWQRPPINPPSIDWLGHQAKKEEIRNSGLWNVHHTKGTYKDGFLKVLEDRVEQTENLTELPENWNLPVCLGETRDN